LVLRGQEVAVPHLSAGVREVLAQDDVRRQIGIQRAEAVAEPGSEAGHGDSSGAGVHGEDGLEVLEDVGVERPNDAEVVGDLAEVGEKLADLEAAFAVLLERERRREEGLVGAFAEALATDRLAVVRFQAWLIVEGIDM
jgi:hypothetical protein